MTEENRKRSRSADNQRRRRLLAEWTQRNWPKSWPKARWTWEVRTDLRRENREEDAWDQNRRWTRVNTAGRINSNHLDAQPSTWPLISTFVRAVGVGINNTKTLMTKKLKEVRELGGGGGARDSDRGCRTDHRQSIKTSFEIKKRKWSWENEVNLNYEIRDYQARNFISEAIL